MNQFPPEVVKAWEDREGPAILATVDKEDRPNAIYVTCVSKFDGQTVVVADNYFDKTKQNILSGSKTTILFMTSEGKSYQLKGSVSYHTQGPVFDDMKKWNPKKHPGHAAAAIKIEQVFSGAKKII
ncbi:MAG: pyridoxamine 5'-phosphate oxidase family protein [Actinomycetota bacterium]|nr:pyridoxamine 5'-phosphate oxidase family protein [Actinomycetota bacterium]